MERRAEGGVRRGVEHVAIDVGKWRMDFGSAVVLFPLFLYCCKYVVIMVSTIHAILAPARAFTLAAHE